MASGSDLYQDFLYSIAEVAVTLIGFSVVVFILGRRAEAHPSKTEKNGLFHPRDSQVAYYFGLCL